MTYTKMNRTQGNGYNGPKMRVDGTKTSVAGYTVGVREGSRRPQAPPPIITQSNWMNQVHEPNEHYNWIIQSFRPKKISFAIFSDQSKPIGPNLKPNLQPNREPNLEPNLAPNLAQLKAQPRAQLSAQLSPT